MSKIRLLPVVVVAIAALLVLKTLGLVTNGGYVLTGVSVAQAAGAAPAEEASAAAGEHTAEDTSPTLLDSTPTRPVPAVGMVRLLPPRVNMLLLSKVRPLLFWAVHSASNRTPRSKQMELLP